MCFLIFHDRCFHQSELSLVTWGHQQVCFYPYGFQEVQVVQEVLLSVVQPGGRGLTDDFLYQCWHLSVWNRHKVLQTPLTPSPGTHVPQVDPETFQEDLRQTAREKVQRSGSLPGVGTVTDLFHFLISVQTLWLWLLLILIIRVLILIIKVLVSITKVLIFILIIFIFSHSIQCFGLYSVCHIEAESVQTEHVQNVSSPSPGWCLRLWSAERRVQRRRRSSAGSSTESRCLAGSVSTWSLRDKNQKQRLWGHRETWCLLLLPQSSSSASSSTLLPLLLPPSPSSASSPSSSSLLLLLLPDWTRTTNTWTWTPGEADTWGKRCPYLATCGRVWVYNMLVGWRVNALCMLSHVCRTNFPLRWAQRNLHHASYLHSMDKAPTCPPSLFFFYRLKHAGKDKQKHV